MAKSYTQLVSDVRQVFNTGRTQSITWRKSQLKACLKMFDENSEAMCEAMKKDLRKSHMESMAMEINLCRNECVNYIDNLENWTTPQKVKKNLMTLADTCYIRYEPLGTVLVMGAWNYPIQLTMLPIIGAIAAGNCVILKPSELAEATAKLLTDIVPKYFDKEAIVVVNGGVPETTELLKERFDHIFYTGSSVVGKIVMTAASKFLTPVTLELGGKSPCFVDTSSDLMLAARRIIWGKLCNNGQTCVAPDYILCEKTIQEPLVSCMKQVLKEFYGEDIQNSKDLARMINNRHFKRVKTLMESSGKIVIGGKTDEKDLYIAPTVLVDVKPGDAVMQEEIFGPILPIMTVSSPDEAIAFINSREKPLALYIFSKNDKVISRVTFSTSSGGVTANDLLMHAGVDTLPFGGVGNSGMGGYHGKFTFETFSHRRAFMLRAQAMEAVNNLRYPPYSQKKEDWIMWIMKKSPKKTGIAGFFPIVMLTVVIGVIFKALGLQKLLPKSITE
jgi:acyl-CoA reductase-like NAD-dependent aldehyde dehydrogenase